MNDLEIRAALKKRLVGICAEYDIVVEDLPERLTMEDRLHPKQRLAPETLEAIVIILMHEIPARHFRLGCGVDDFGKPYDMPIACACIGTCSLWTSVGDYVERAS